MGSLGTCKSVKRQRLPRLQLSQPRNGDQNKIINKDVESIIQTRVT